MAANAFHVACTCCTLVSWSWTEELSHQNLRPRSRSCRPQARSLKGLHRISQNMPVCSDELEEALFERLLGQTFQVSNFGRLRDGKAVPLSARQSYVDLQHQSYTFTLRHSRTPRAKLIPACIVLVKKNVDLQNLCHVVIDIRSLHQGRKSIGLYRSKHWCPSFPQLELDAHPKKKILAQKCVAFSENRVPVKIHWFIIFPVQNCHLSAEKKAYFAGLRNNQSSRTLSANTLRTAVEHLMKSTLVGGRPWLWRNHQNASECGFLTHGGFTVKPSNLGGYWIWVNRMETQNG